jgi:pyruvate,water dikinase
MNDNMQFVPPGPGVWERESTHLVRPVSRALAAVFPEASTAGFRWSMERYGLLLDYLEFATVNRFVYMAARPVGAPKSAKGAPPKLIFKLLVKLHPEVRKRVRTITEVWKTKRWREDVARWDAEWKPAIARENSKLQSVDPRALTDEELIHHVAHAIDATRRGAFRHHSLNATTMLPLGDFLVHVRAWTGKNPAEVLPLFRGASRVSQGANDELEVLAGAIALNDVKLEGDDPRAIVDALLARNDSVGDAARRYVEAAGVRVATGYDFADLTVAEMPELLLENIRSAVSGKPQTTEDDVKQREAALRDAVPAQHRALFDELLAEARFVYRIRDERGYLNDAWSVGIARRAILAAGERLVAKGQLHAADHAVELTPDEITAMLAGGSGPSADEAAAHAHFRTTNTFHDAPKHLGGVPSGPPPADWLPPDAARAARAIDIVMGEMFAARADQSDDQRDASAQQITGFAASHGQVSGVARLVLDPSDMARVRKGDILITRSTAPSYNALLPLLSGIVTDRGGTLSHAAVVAREYGIPAVVGCGNATQMIRDGMRVYLDGARGTVELFA